MFAYCENNPVIYIDSSGHSALLIGLAVIGISGFFACVSQAGQARTQAAFDAPSFYNIGNWLTMGAFDMVKGTFAPEEPLSAQHWIDSFGTATFILPALSYIDDAVRNSSVATNVASDISRGSTGRVNALNYKEQLAMEQVRSNPLDGAVQVNLKMNDTRWPATEGWVKMANNVNGVEIHFVYNPTIHIFDDFKFGG